jgi:hypothetical protein
MKWERDWRESKKGIKVDGRGTDHVIVKIPPIIEKGRHWLEHWSALYREERQGERLNLAVNLAVKLFDQGRLGIAVPCL